MPFTDHAAEPTVVLVEDYFSALRLCQTHKAVPLLGTSLSLGVLNCVRGLRVLFCLDTGATQRAIQLANKYSILFQSTLVVSLEDKPDIKDMDETEYQQLLTQLT